MINEEIKNLKRNFHIFTPGKKFPSISLTGKSCDLNCAHCGGKFLDHMLVVNSTQELMRLCENLSSNGAVGALISGGCDSFGHMKLKDYLEVFKKVKKNTDLILNVHTGIISHEQAESLAKCDIDIVSIDVVGDKETIKTIYGLDYNPNHYKESLKALNDSGIARIVPHICIGLNYGQMSGEKHAIDLISTIVPETLVFIILIPTKGTKMEECDPPKIDETLTIIEYARKKFPKTNIYLGCMRPKGSKFRKYNIELEQRAILAGINGVVLPTKNTINFLRNLDVDLDYFENCCAVI